MIRHLFVALSICLFLFGCSASKKTAAKQPAEPRDIVVGTITPPPVKATPNPVDSINNALRRKYAQYLQVSPDSITNIKLYAFIDKWLNVPYKWGGADQKGIDCSAFIQRLLTDVYDIKIPRTSIQQLYTQRVELFKSAKYLSEGDIVFFRTVKDKVVSHVGIYLGNYMFVNCSSSKGVSIASLKAPYWKTRYVAAGRIKAYLAMK